MKRFHQRIGEAGCEKMPEVMMNAGTQTRTVKRAELKRIFLPIIHRKFFIICFFCTGLVLTTHANSTVINRNGGDNLLKSSNAIHLCPETPVEATGDADDCSQIPAEEGLAFSGIVNAPSMADVEVLLIADGLLEKIIPDATGSFKIYDLPDGEYAVKVRKPGFKSAPATRFTVGSESAEAKSSAAHPVEFSLEELSDDGFSFHWEEDQSTAGYDYSAHINDPQTVEFLGEQLEPVDDASANHLQHDYNMLLVDTEKGAWTQEHAYRLLTMMRTIPQQVRDPYKAQSLPASKWELTNDFIEGDIQITVNGRNKTVLISEAAFTNASPRVAKVEGKRGVYYSQRLHHALVRYVTEEGANVSAYEEILRQRYGVTTQVNDYATLTAATTIEHSGRFQAFHPEEIIQIINMFEEMPAGMHKLPELRYLIRRLDGTPHPLYDEAPAVAWPDSGYIEFMELAFNADSISHVHRLIVHEKAHFLWAHQFDHQLIDDWIELGGWFEDVNSESGWLTSKQTEFVSAYAHLKTPDEDMAESIAHFIVNPDLLKSRAINKYNFVRDRIMQGNFYLSQIREDLTFQVYNLYPDYVFPGKIKRVDIAVAGAAEDDKTVEVEIEIHALDSELEGASHAYLRIFSDTGTFVDLYLYPIDEFGNSLSRSDLSTTLRGSFSLSKYARAGFWRTNQIVLTDTVGNKRMAGANDFGWKLYVDNPLEDNVAPQYVENTAAVSKSLSTIEGQEVQIIHARWQVDEAIAMSDRAPCYASLNDEIPSTYSVQKYGSYNENIQHCEVDFIMPHYYGSSVYSMNYIKMKDAALNVQGVYFTRPPGHALREEDMAIDELPQEIELTTNNPDIELPELELNDIDIVAEPTNLEAPNGETLVTITYKVRDNISGYKHALLYLRDPQGIEHYYWAQYEGSWSLFHRGDPTQWRTYTRRIILPAGSAPGTWGLSEMTIYDRAGNFNSYDFTELIHFDVEE